MSQNILKKKKNNQDISYLNRDFESFRNNLVQYAKLHYSDKIKDFSESSLAGLFVDMASYVGDVMSFYMDHQFNELNLETAIESKNISRLIRQSGVEIFGASPSRVNVTVTIKSDALLDSSGDYICDPEMLPIIKSGTIFSSSAGVDFELIEDIDFSKKLDGELIASKSLDSVDGNGNPLTYELSLPGICTSSSSNIDVITIPDERVSFREITLGKRDVSEIISVIDEDGDNYYEVESLTQNLVFLREINDLPDHLSVPERLVLKPAPKRYIRQNSRSTGLTTLIFGSGDEDVFDEDIIPDPSEFAIKMFGDKKDVNFASIDPRSFLRTQTLGISPKNTKLTIVYRSGGGLNHNIAAGQINDVDQLITVFQSQVSASKIARCRSSLQVTNLLPSAGGEDEPSLNALKQISFSSINLQNRIVTREDLLARIYTIPNNFGRVYRAGIRNNPFNPLGSHLHILCRDASGHLNHAPDTLKSNISTYLETYRLISDAIDIVDGRIVNIGIEYRIKISSDYESSSVLNGINNDLKKYFNIENFQIDQPLYVSEVLNIILNTPGVMYIQPFNNQNIVLKNKRGVFQNRNYSSVSYSPNSYISNGVYYPPPGGIFEVKFPNDDIKGIIV